MRLIVNNRHFAPYYWVQFLGALNDNIFKNALVILITYRSVELWGWDKFILVPLAGGIFILPWFLFSAMAGQLGDRFQKATLIRLIKVAEIGIVILGIVGLVLEDFGLLMVTLFLLGVQSSIFGPLKYSIIPSLVSRNTLMEATSYVTGGTFVAILLGTILGGVLVSWEGGLWGLGGILLTSSVLGWLFSCWVDNVPVYNQSLKIDYTLVFSIGRILKMTWQRPDIFRMLMGISWFWFLGAAVLSLLPLLVQDLLQGSEEVTTFFLGIFVVGMGGGTLLVKKLSPDRTEIGLIPISLLGTGLALLDLYMCLSGVEGGQNTEKIYGLREFLELPFTMRFTADIFLLALFGGVYIVSQMTYIQQKSPPEELSRIISGNNIWNALFMVLSSVFVAGFSKTLGVVNEVLILGLASICVAFLLYIFYSDYVWRIISWILIRLFYKIEVRGLENIPEDGPVIIASNHVSFVDGPLLMGACSRPVHFVVDWNYYYMPMGPLFFRQVQAIPIATSRESGEVLEKAFEAIFRHLDRGAVIGIFPEGRITWDGKLNTFQPGISKVIRHRPVPVVLCGLDGIWGSIFSREGGGSIWERKPKGFRIPIRITFSTPIKAEDYDSALAKEIIKTYVSHAQDEK